MARAGSIYVSLMLQDGSYRAGLSRAGKATKDATSSWQRDLNKTGSAFSAVLNPVRNLGAAVGQLGAIFAGAFSVQKLVQYSDTWRQLEGRMSLSASSLAEVVQQQKDLYEIAQRTRQPLEGITSFYSRLKQFIPEAERAQFDLLGVTESVASALAITGETGASASAAMIQFTQAIGTNFEAAGQELRSLQEQAPRLTKALMDALGGGTKSLQQLKDEGKLTRESVLNALSGMGDEGRRLRDELSKIPTTVSQALTNLNSAFLQFIGTNQNVQGATSALSAAINALSRNLDLVANAVVLLAGVYTVRLIPALTVSIGLWVNNTRQVLLYQTALARMAGVSTVAAGAILTLSRAMALLGGPIGIALIAAAAAYGHEQQRAADIQQKYNEALSKTQSLSAEYIGASKERQEEIKKEIKNLVDLAKAEAGAAQAAFLRANSKVGQTGVFGRISPIGGIIEKYNTYEADKALEEMQQAGQQYSDLIKIMDGLGKDSVTNTNTTSSNKKRADTQKELNSTYERYEHIIHGVSRETIAYGEALDDLQKLKDAGIIKDEQWIEVQRRLSEEMLSSKEVANEFGLDIETMAKRAAENIQDTFADFLFDPFQDGLKGMAKGFIDSVRRMIAEAQAAQLAKYLFGGIAGGSGGGVLGDIFGSIFGDTAGSIDSAGREVIIPSGDLFSGFFADGGFIEPGKWGFTGEEGIEAVYGGRSGATVVPNDKMGGSNSYVFNVGTDVNKRDIQRLEQMVMMTAGPGVVEQRIVNAQRRGVV